jgi:hypothetical protein
MPLLMAATSLDICGASDITAHLPRSYLSAIARVAVLNPETFVRSPLKLDTLPSLKTLELRNITIWCKYHDEAYLETKEADECMISLAMFNLNRISTLCTKLCDDNERSFRVILCCQYVASSVRDETIVCGVWLCDKILDGRADDHH